MLLNALHLGVLELGVGRCHVYIEGVTKLEHPVPDVSLGFVLVAGPARWEFLIQAPLLKLNVLTPDEIKMFYQHMRTPAGRVVYAALLQDGIHPLQLPRSRA